MLSARTTPGTEPVDAPFAVVDQVLAVVDLTPILRSDVVLMETLGVVPREEGESDDDYRERLLVSRIRLELQFRDLEDSGLLYRLDMSVPVTLERLTERVGGFEAVRESLADQGLVEQDVADLALRVAASEAYVEQRLQPRVAVSFDELEAAYQEMVVDPLRESGHVPPPLASVRSQLRDVLVERKISLEIDRWVDQARRQRDVTRFPTSD